MGHRLRQGTGKTTYEMSRDVFDATLSKQSVLATFAGVFITGIWITPNNVIKRFDYIVAYISTIGFSFSIILLLVSMTCYDYSTRFRWKSTAYQAKLVGKGLRLDIISWYLLLDSLLISLNRFSPALSLLSSILAGFLLWYYYFLSDRTKRPMGGLKEEMAEVAGISPYGR